jgi:acyl-CoA thioesterase
VSLSAEEVARRSAEVMWAGDHASRALGMRIIEVAPGLATLEMAVREDMVTGHGVGRGGLTFSLADSAFAFACNSRNRRTVAHHCEITYLAPTRLGDVLTAVAVERSRDGRAGAYDVTVRTAAGVVAEFVGMSKEVRGHLFAEEEDT